MKVYVLEQGDYSSRSVVDVFTTPEAAMAAGDAYFRKTKWTASEEGGVWYSGHKYDGCAVTEYEVQTKARPK
jgi:hypothetical protein